MANSRCAIPQSFLTRGFADDASLKKTPLYDFHVENGGNSLFVALSLGSYWLVEKCWQIVLCQISNLWD